MSGITIGLIGGSGLSEALAAKAGGEAIEVDTPFGPPSAPVFKTQWAGLNVFSLARHGAGHVLNPSQVPYRANIFALKKLGCTHILASGAVGGLREEFRPRDLVIPDQIIDKTRRPGTFYEKAAVHVDFAEPFCPVLRQILLDAGKEAGNDPNITVHSRGCYVCMEGPAFSTRAESLMHRLWGGDLIGMTAMPEAKLAREAEISYALVALVTDYDCWRPRTAEQEKEDPFVVMSQVVQNLQAASDSAVALIQRAVERCATSAEALLAAPAQSALKPAIWSDKSRIDSAEIERLRPLWGRYFGDRA